MAYASYATLSEAWGMAGDPAHVTSTPAPSIDPPRPRPASTPFNPSPSDVDYSSAGAPILDDIVNLYTPADMGAAASAQAQTRQPTKVPPLPSDPTIIQGKVLGNTLPSLPPRRMAPSPLPPAPRRQFTRKSDDYDDDSDSDSEVVDRRRRRRQPQQQLIPSIGDTTHTIELAAYVLSGVMLIFLFESFISIGMSMRVTSSYY